MNTERPEVRSSDNEMDFSWELWQSFQDLPYHDLSAFILVEFEHLLGIVRGTDQSVLLKRNTVQQVYRLACVLWQSQETICDLKALLKEDGYDALLDWTLTARGPEYNLIKLAIDRVLCSVCSIEPDSYYDRLLTRLGILSGNASRGKVYRFRHVVPGFDEIPDLDEVPDFEDEEPVCLQHSTSIDVSCVNLSENALKTLGVVSLSYMTANQLINSKFLSVLIDLIVDFIINDESTLLGNDESAAAAAATSTTSTNTKKALPGLESLIVDVELVARILDFFAELCWQNICKIWFRSDRNTILWDHLLRYLCVRVPKSLRCEEYLLKSKPTVISLRKLEQSTINYFSKCCCGRFKNQDKFSQIFYNVLSSEIRVGSGKIGIPDFMRRILVEFVIMPQHVYVSIETDLPEGMNKMENCVDPSLLLPHPAFPTSEKRQLLYASVDYTCTDILRKLKCAVEDVAVNSAPPKEERSTPKEERSTTSQFMARELEFPFTHYLSSSSSHEPPRNMPFWEEPSIPQAKKIKVHNYGSTRSTDVVENPQSESDESGGDVNLTHDLEIKSSSSAAIEPYKLMFWNSNAYEYEEIGQCDAISRILQSSVPPEDELGVTVLKFLLLRRDNHKEEKEDDDDQEEEHVTRYNLFVHSAFKKFVALDGFTYIALHVERQVRSSALQYMSMHTLLVFGHLIRLLEYRAQVRPSSVLESIIGSAEVASFVPEKHRNLFSNDIKTIHNPLMLLPFELLRSTIAKMYKSNAPSPASDARLISVIDFVLVYLAVCTHQPQGTYTCAIAENEVCVEAMRQSYVSRLKNKIESAGQSYWPSGTGYSTYLSTCEPFAMAASSARPGEFLQSLEEEEIVTAILTVLGKFINPRLSLAKLSCAKYREGICSAELSRPLHPLTVKQLEGSCVLRVVADNLRNDSVFDIVRHIPLYKAIMSVLCSMVSNVRLRNVVVLTAYAATTNAAETADYESPPSIPLLMANLRKRIQEYLRRVRVDDRNVRVQRLKDDSDFKEQVLLEEICHTADIIETIKKKLSVSEPTNAISTENRESNPVVQNDYVASLQGLQFGEYEMMTSGNNNDIRFTLPHHFSKEALERMITVPGRIKRLAMEITSLASSLPLSRESAIFVRHDSSRIDIIKALISGPPGTPYMNGLFEFDIFCPSNFPNEPIQVNLETTGRGTVRFNPNLYDSGNVCLSLLNTWEGERWNPKTSSILQVLVSIQGMILIPEPYFNEPGYERHRNTNRGNDASKAYNDNLLPSTVRWAMIEQILSPAACFKEVIYTHFYLKKDEIKEQVTGWISDCKGNSKSRLQFEAKQLFDVLDKLPPPKIRT